MRTKMKMVSCTSATAGRIRLDNECAFGLTAVQRTVCVVVVAVCMF